MIKVKLKDVNKFIALLGAVNSLMQYIVFDLCQSELIKFLLLHARLCILMRRSMRSPTLNLGIRCSYVTLLTFSLCTNMHSEGATQPFLFLSLFLITPMARIKSAADDSIEYVSIVFQKK